MPRPRTWIAAVLSACIAGTSAAPADARRLRPPADGPVLLAGEVLVDGNHSGVIELRLDGKLHSTVPVGNGGFELAMPRDGGARMVTLEFRAPQLRLRSLLGGQARLVQRAGTDGRLDVDEEDRLRLTPLSTALAVLAQLDGVPDSDGGLADAVQAAWPSDMVLGTTAIARLAAEPWRLPHGFPDGLALAEDPVAFSKAIQADPGLVSEPHLVIDPLPASPLRGADIDGALVFTGARMAPGLPPTGPGLVMEREDGGFRLHDHMFDGPGWSGVLDAEGGLLMTPVTPVVEFGGYYPCPSLGRDVAGTVTTMHRDFRRLWRAAGVSVWQHGIDRVLGFPECPGLAEVAWRTAELWAAPDMPRLQALTSPRRFIGRQSLPVFCGVPLPHWGLALEPCGQADHVFNADGSGLAHPADAAPLAFSWGLGEHGAIRVDYGEEASSRFWIIDAGDRTGQPVAYVAAGVVAGYPGTSSGQATLVRGGLAEGGNRPARLPVRRAPAPRFDPVGD